MAGREEIPERCSGRGILVEGAVPGHRSRGVGVGACARKCRETRGVRAEDIPVERIVRRQAQNRHRVVEPGLGQVVSGRTAARHRRAPLIGRRGLDDGDDGRAQDHGHTERDDECETSLVSEDTSKAVSESVGQRHQILVLFRRKIVSVNSYAPTAVPLTLTAKSTWREARQPHPVACAKAGKTVGGEPFVLVR